MKRLLLALCCAGFLAAPAHANKAQVRKPTTPAVQIRDGQAEARLIEIYQLIGRAEVRQALERAERLVNEHPNFQLAQLAYADLLALRSRPLRVFGDAPDGIAGTPTLEELRDESLLRMRALRERPPVGHIPEQFLQLSPRNRHAIAIDASRARLYLFENAASGPRLLADYYISVGKSGVEKSAEGDLRTPLGVYFITSNLDPRSLKDFYGSGALPINYPNAWDLRRGKTGSGIWLHGTPPNQFARAPRATDGCIVLANPDLERVLRTVATRTTPVVIAQNLRWVPTKAAEREARAFAEVLKAWREAKSNRDMPQLLRFYTQDFRGDGKALPQWMPVLQSEFDRARGRPIQLKDVSVLRWTDSADTMVVTFGEVVVGSRKGSVRRQYWMRQGVHWKIFFEGVIG